VSNILELPLWSSGQSFCLQIQRSGFDSRRYQVFWEVMGLEQGPLSLVSTTEELLGRNSSGYGLERREYGRGDPLHWSRAILYPQKLALISPTSGGRMELDLFCQTSLKSRHAFRKQSYKGRIFEIHFIVNPDTDNPVRSMRNVKCCSQFGPYLRHVAYRKADEPLVCSDEAWQCLQACIVTSKEKYNWWVFCWWINVLSVYSF
jgi:hypothetical protein